MAADLTTADVYEDASLIGQDIEKIIERFGHDAMTDLMPKIIRVLEKLEIVVGEREKDKLEIAEMKLENQRLYLDIKREASQRRKLDEELYHLSSTGETDNLKTMLVKLQEENRKLRMEFEVSASTRPATAYISAPGDAELMHKMKEAIDNQRDTIRSKNMEIDSLRNDLQAVEEQIDRLTTINESVRKTLGASKARIHALAKEKAELQTELRALRLKGESPLESDDSEDPEDVEGFMDSFTEQQEHNSAEEDEEEEKEEGEEVDEETVQNSEGNPEEVVGLSNGKPPPKPPRLKLEAEENADVLNNNENNVGDNERKGEMGGKENEINVKQNGNDDERANDGDWEIVGRTRTTAYRREKSKEERKERRAENQQRAEKENKDPNRPRYTKAEMLEILTERNNLKEKVFALQDELKIYKPGYSEEDEYGHLTRKISTPRRREESGISRIFSIFTRKGDH